MTYFTMTAAERVASSATATQKIASICQAVLGDIQSRNGAASTSDVVYEMLAQAQHLLTLNIKRTYRDDSLVVPVLPSAGMQAFTRRHLRSFLDTLREKGKVKHLRLATYTDGRTTPRPPSLLSMESLDALELHLLQGMRNARPLYPNIREYFGYVLAPLVGTMPNVQAWEQDLARHERLMALPLSELEARMLVTLTGLPRQALPLYKAMYSLMLLSYQLDSTSPAAVAKYIQDVMSVLNY